MISAEKQLPEKENFVVKILKYSSHSKREREKREKRFEREIRYVYQIQQEIEEYSALALNASAMRISSFPADGLYPPRLLKTLIS